MTKPNCYECKHRCNVAGSEHSSCKHPLLKGRELTTVMRIMAVGKSVSGYGTNYIKVSGEHHGIINGWFSYPMDFDPVWLIECNGYEAR